MKSETELPCESHIQLEEDESYPHYHAQQRVQEQGSAPTPEPRNVTVPSPVEETKSYPQHHAQQQVQKPELAPPQNHPGPYAEPQRPIHPWLSLIMSFCFAGISIGFQSIQASKHLPLSFHVAGLGVVLALAAFVVSKYIPERLKREAKFLENTGVFFGVTAFFLYITLSFPLSIKIISWIIYATVLLAILLTRYFHFSFLTRQIE